MVIKPSECLDPTEEENRMFARSEEQVDDVLKREFGKDGTDEVTVGNRLLPSNLRVKQRLIKAYEDAGWSTKYVSDQIDGGFYVFKKK